MAVVLRKSMRPSGFTIVELLIVIVVIGILAAITIVSYQGVQKSAQIAAQQSDLRSITQALSIHVIDGESLVNPSTWRRALDDTKLYNDISRDGIDTAKSMMICAKNDQYVIGAWRPVQTVEADAKDIIVSANGSITRFKWNNTVTGSTTLERFCKQVKEATGVDVGDSSAGGFWTWMHNEGIKDAPL